MRNLVWVSGLVLSIACGGGGSGNTQTNTPTTTSSATPTGSGATSQNPKAPLQDLIKKTLADFDAAYAAHDAAKCAAAYASDAVFTQPTHLGFNEHKKEEVQKNLEALFKSFPDVKLTPTRQYMKGNAVVIEGVMTGTHNGEYMGHAATNKKFGHRYIALLWFNDNGLIAKEHLYHDHAAMLGHLGKGDPKLQHRNIEAIPTMTLEQVSPGDNALEAKNTETVKQFLASFEKKDDKIYTAALADDITHADYTRPEDAKGKDAAKKAFGELLKTFPDLKMTPTNIMAVGDHVIVEIEMSGTMKGDLGSIKPSGKSGTAHIVDVFRFNKDGKIAWAGRWGSRPEFAAAFGVPAKATK
jgi:ketosteroid isomerase-like protein